MLTSQRQGDGSERGSSNSGTWAPERGKHTGSRAYEGGHHTGPRVSLSLPGAGHMHTGRELKGESVTRGVCTREKGQCVQRPVSGKKSLVQLGLLGASQCGLTQSTGAGSETRAREPDSAKKWENHPVDHGLPLRGVAGMTFTL